ncbi:uncharacterized protein PHACADRAFT_254636 [Phanerochaete carnosa HHB-10118-sp]|uniref:Transmembrane protein n=1 Tax=Phanerochaete carnosa (strain HHB-10118-sp) TaxID=650164 RepID=K5WDH6_PHACS|nr:uncharacterized protein PHACADRAFT_254636 [Phanerochaete carnosa HHB-10118-sp]EKM57084.1 hypothetical protein PHACADRAFT_254636 [Phanerochaete carnosa HHB-10118-sp]
MMDSDLPLDTSHPAVRDYLALVRLQILTPLSLLINMATVMVCTLTIYPNLGDIAKLYPAVIVPDPRMIAIYLGAIYLGQVGYCVLLVLARKRETKDTLVKGVGLPLVFANWVMAGWAVAWLFQAFLISAILQGILLVLLVYANVVLLIYHAPTHERLLDIALIHAPVRAFMILPLGVLFAYNLFVTLGMTWSPGEPQHYGRHQWAGLGVMLGVNLLSLIIIVLRRDIVWCVAASWIDASIWVLKPKPFPVFITVVIFTIVHPLALVASALWMKLRSRHKEGAIRLPEDEAEERGGQRGPREVDAEALWG